MENLNLIHKFDKDLITEGDETLKLKLFTDSDLTEQVGVLRKSFKIHQLSPLDIEFVYE